MKIINPRFYKLISREGENQSYCPICLEKLTSSKYCVQGNHKFSLKDWGICSFYYYLNNRLYAICLRTDIPFTTLSITDLNTGYSIFRIDLDHIMDDFDFKDINAVVQRIETYSLFS